MLKGKFEIIKLPWKPKVGEKYYTFNRYGLNRGWHVHSHWWADFPAERALLDKGWVYRTEAAAKTALPAVAAEMGVEYEI